MNLQRNEIDRAFVLAALRLLALFALVFYGADALTAQRDSRWHFYFDWELAIPYWPTAYPVYFSVVGLPFVVPACARDARQVQRWERAMALTIVIAGAVFVALPSELGYAAADAGDWQPWAAFAQGVAGRYNLLPSLHVALSLVTLMAAWPMAGPRLRRLLLGWFALLAASVLVTHQHHVSDVVAGVVLALARMDSLRSTR